jgi:hypothetical protein
MKFTEKTYSLFSRKCSDDLRHLVLGECAVLLAVQPGVVNALALRVNYCGKAERIPHMPPSGGASGKTWPPGFNMPGCTYRVGSRVFTLPSALI